MDQPLSRQYILLRPAAPGGTGFARLEQHRRRFSVALQITLPGAHMPLRALLLSGSPGTGAVQDLGAFTTDATGRGRLFRENLALGEGLALFHTLVVAEDWPHPALLFHGPLHHCAVPLWQLKEAVCQYLAVPAERPAEAGTAKPMQPPPVERTPSVQQLPTLHWPESLRPLQEWFESAATLCPLQRARLAFRARTALRKCASILLCRRHFMPRRRPLRGSVCASRPLYRHAAAGITSCPLAGGPPRRGLLGTRPAPFGELCKPLSRFVHIPSTSLTLSVNVRSKISNAHANG